MLDSDNAVEKNKAEKGIGVSTWREGQGAILNGVITEDICLNIFLRNKDRVNSKA